MKNLAFIITLLITLQMVSSCGQKQANGTKNDQPDTLAMDNLIRKAFIFAQDPARDDSTTFYLDQLYPRAVSANYSKGIVEYFRIKAIAAFVRKQEDSINVNLQRALKEAQRLNDQKEEALVLDVKGWIFQNREENDSATSYFMRALKTAEQIRDEKFSGEIANNLSTLFWAIGDFDKASQFAVETLSKGRKLKDTLLIANGLFNLGNAKTRLKQYDTALVLFRQVKAMVHDPVKYNYVLFRAYGNEAATYTEMNQLDESIDAHEQILKLFQNVDPSLLSYIYSGLGQAQFLKKQLSEAEKNLRAAISINNSSGQKHGLRDNYLTLSQIKQAQSDFQTALRYREKFDSLNDTLMNETRIKNMHLLERKFNLAKKDNEIGQQQLSIEKNKRIIQEKNNLNAALVAGILIMIILSVLIYRNIMHRHRLLKQSEALKKQQILELEKEKQLTAAQYLMKGQEEERTRLARDLHDGVGGLLSGVKLSMSNMKGNVFLSEENAHTFNNVIVQLDHSITELRRVSHNMMPESLIKYGLKEALENYCESLNLSGKIKVTLQTYGMDERMEQSTEIIIYRMVQELLNNVIKHAAANNVLIQLACKDERFNLTVEDDGKGFDMADNKNAHGAGLSNIRARAAYLNGSVDIISAIGEGTSVNIEGALTI